jgi:hypothetical protein
LCEKEGILAVDQAKCPTTTSTAYGRKLSKKSKALGHRDGKCTNLAAYSHLHAATESPRTSTNDEMDEDENLKTTKSKTSPLIFDCLGN